MSRPFHATRTLSTKLINHHSLGHELVAGAASFAAMREYEKHEEQNGLARVFMSSSCSSLRERVEH